MKKNESLLEMYERMTGKSIIQGLAELIADEDWLEKVLGKNKPKLGTRHIWKRYGDPTPPPVVQEDK